LITAARNGNRGQPDSVGLSGCSGPLGTHEREARLSDSLSGYGVARDRWFIGTVDDGRCLLRRA
jgi:hypothetical protein